MTSNRFENFSRVTRADGTITKTGSGIIDIWYSGAGVTPSIKNFAGLINVQQGVLAEREPWRSLGDAKLLARYARERAALELKRIAGIKHDHLFAFR